MREKIEFISGILLVSENPSHLADFYRNIIGIDLEKEEHDDTLPHWGCTMGDIHFAIHPVEDFPDNQSGVGAVKLAFNVFDIHAIAKRLEASGIALLYPIEDTGYFLSTALLDPDGNFLELTQMCDEWFEYLQERHARGHDVVKRWHDLKKKK